MSRCNLHYNYLNIQEKNFNIYFRIVLMVNQISLQTEFATMSFLSLPQSKGVFLRSARDLVVNGCGIPYNTHRTTFYYITLFGRLFYYTTSTPPHIKELCRLQVLCICTSNPYLLHGKGVAQSYSRRTEKRYHLLNTFHTG